MTIIPPISAAILCMALIMISMLSKTVAVRCSR